MIRVGVVGASGNVGTAVLRRFLAPDATDVEVALAVSRRTPDLAQPPYDGVGRWLSCDVGRPTAPRELAEAFRGLDAVVLLAWALQPTRDPELLYRTNVVGTRVALEAAVRAGVPHVLYASSVGAYAGADKSLRVDEHWPVTGVDASQYSRHKAETEAWLDDVAGWHPDLTITRLRPGLVFQRQAASEIARYFLGSVLRAQVAVRLPLPALPLSRQLVFQAVHADDLAEAFLLAVQQGLGGAFNIAAEPVLGPDDLARAFGTRRVLPVPHRLLRGVAAATWRLHLQPTSPGWLDLAGAAPIMDTARARTALGWSPEVTATNALRELVDGFADRAKHPGPLLGDGDLDLGGDDPPGGRAGT